MKGARELGLSSCEDSDNEERPDTLDNASTGWVDLERAKDVPKILIKNIHRYFITKKVRKDQVTARKPFERGYRIYDAKKVRSICIHYTAADSLFSASILGHTKLITCFSDRPATNDDPGGGEKNQDASLR